MDVSFVFFFNDTATTEIYTLSLHDALPICVGPRLGGLARLELGLGHLRSPCRTCARPGRSGSRCTSSRRADADRKSTRLNSSHANISYAVFCLKKKKI